MIEFKDVAKNYHNKKSSFIALQNINLSIKEGEIFGVIGKSGAGKSTLLRCINLLERPSKGQVIFNHTNLTSLNSKELRDVRRKIGMIFQHFNLLSQSTVFQNIALPLEVAGHSQKEINKRVNYLLKITDLLDKKNRYPDELSGGQKQRVAIARALANKPSVLLCDEATSALDVENTKSILTLLKRINRVFNVTIILITHQIEVIKAVCHRVAVMESGNIVEVTDKNTFFNHPQSEQGQSFLQIHSLEDELKEVLQ